MIRHIVLFSFKKEMLDDDVRKADNLFKTLPHKIEEIMDFESGINISPEGLNKGFTHAYNLSFSDEKTRDIYLNHKDHKLFSESIADKLEDVLVIDYKI